MVKGYLQIAVLGSCSDSVQNLLDVKGDDSNYPTTYTGRSIKIRIINFHAQ